MATFRRSSHAVAVSALCVVFTATMGLAADLPAPSRSASAFNGGASAALGRADLRPVPREWIQADAGAVVDASELVVLTPDQAAADTVSRLAVQRGYEVIRTDVLSGLNQVVIVLRIPPGRTGPEAIAEIEALDGRATAGVNHAYPVPLGGTGLERFQFADAMIGWPVAGCQSFARIGLVDTGIDPAVAQNLNARITTEHFQRAPDHQSGTEHGSTLATLLAGKGRLIEPQIFNAVVAGDGDGNEAAAGVDDLLRALDWLSRENVRIANVSLAGPYNKILDLGVQSAVANGMVIVAAAGNDGPDANPRFPAAFDDVVAVTAVDADQDVYRNAVRGPHIDLAAPGVDVAVALKGEPRFVSGTSVAAPFVTAMLAADPRILGPSDPSDIVADYEQGARDVGESGRDDVFGFGILLAPEACP